MLSGLSRLLALAPARSNTTRSLPLSTPVFCKLVLRLEEGEIHT